MRKLLIAILLFGVAETITIKTAKGNDKDTIKNDIHGYNRFFGQKIYIKKSDYNRDSINLSRGFTYTADNMSVNRIVYPVTVGRYANQNVVSYNDSLTNKIFVCVGIIEKGDIIKDYFLKLDNPITGIIYYNLSDGIENIISQKDLEITKKQEFDKKISDQKKIDNPCSQIEFDNDEVRGFKSYTTPIDINSTHMVYINKIIEPNKKPQYYIHFRINEPVGKTVNGVFIVLGNGKRIARPNQEINLEIDKEESDGISHFGYKQGATIELSEADILLLRSSPIIKYAVSYLTETLYNSDDLYKMFLCLLNKK